MECVDSNVNTYIEKLDKFVLSMIESDNECNTESSSDSSSDSDAHDSDQSDENENDESDDQNDIPYEMRFQNPFLLRRFLRTYSVNK